jgi:hypothetical protein
VAVAEANLDNDVDANTEEEDDNSGDCRPPNLGCGDRMSSRATAALVKAPLTLVSANRTANS